MIKTVNHRVIKTNPASKIDNTQAAGIGRLGAFKSELIINNLGKNIEIARLDSQRLTSLACFDETCFPDQDDESQFDLDIHAFIPWNERLIAINHFGHMRVFPFGTEYDGSKITMKSIYPETTLKWPGDVERFVMVGSNLISTSPQGYSVSDAKMPGILISESLEPNFVTGGDAANRCLENTTDDSRFGRQIPVLRYENYLEDWGITSSLALNKDGSCLAVAAADRVGVFALEQRNRSRKNSTTSFDSDLRRENDSRAQTVPDSTVEHNLTLGDLYKEFRVPFHTTFLQFNGNGSLLCAGYDLACHDTAHDDWEKLGGGGWCLMDMYLRLSAKGDFAQNLAWGNGAEPIVISEDGNTFYGFDRLAGLHAWFIDTGKHFQIFESFANGSLGLAHATALNDSIACGFNRDGYRIHHYTF